MKLKQIFGLFMMLFLICIVGCAFADTHPNTLVGQPIRRGTYSSYDCLWGIADDTLYIWPVNGESGTLPTYYSASDGYHHYLDSNPWPWYKPAYNYGNDVKKIVIEGHIVANDCFHLCSFSNLEEYDISGLDTSNCTDMGYMFGDFKGDTLDLTGLNTSNVLSMSHMFTGCVNLVNVVGIEDLDTSHVTNMSSMFSGCKSIVSMDSICGWDVSNVTTFGYMFNGCSLLESLDLSSWNTAAVNGLQHMFEGCGNVTSLNLSNWDVDSVTSAVEMFENCVNLQTLDISGWNLTAVKYLYMMFMHCEKLEYLDLSGWDTRNVYAYSNSDMAEDMDACFWYCNSLSSVLLGEKNIFRNVYGSGDLTTPPVEQNGVYYSGRWVRQDGTAGPYLSHELRENYQSSFAGLWVRETTTPIEITFTATDGAVGEMPKVMSTAERDYYIPYRRYSIYDGQFLYWEDNYGNQYADRALIPGGTWTVGEDVTLTAVFQKNKYGVDMLNGEYTFNLLGGSTAVFKDVPANTIYQVYEQTPVGWVLVSTNDESGIVESLDSANALFGNEYDPDKVHIQLVVTKLLDGSPAPVDSFHFQLLDENNSLLQIKDVGNGGSVVFDPLEFTITDIGEYHYVIREIASGNDGVVYDAHDCNVTITTVDHLFIPGVEGRWVSHTPNISDDGVQQSNYATDLDMTEVITVPGAETLHIVVTYGGESSSYDWACVWSGNHPTYHAYDDYASSVSGKLGGGYHTSASNTVAYDIVGDTVTIGYRSDYSGCGDGYGYYAVVTSEDTTIEGLRAFVAYDGSQVFENVSKPGRLLLRKQSSGDVSADQMFYYEIQFKSDNGMPYDLQDTEISYESRDGIDVEYPDLQPIERPKHTLTVEHYTRTSKNYLVKRETQTESLSKGDVITVQASEAVLALSFSGSSEYYYVLASVDQGCIQSSPGVYKNVMPDHDLTIKVIYDEVCDFKLNLKWKGIETSEKPEVTAYLYDNGELIRTANDVVPGEPYYFMACPRYRSDGSMAFYSVVFEDMDGYFFEKGSHLLTYVDYDMWIGFKGKIVWDDNDNADGLRPTSSFNVAWVRPSTTSLRGVSASNNWSYEFHTDVWAEFDGNDVRVSNSAVRDRYDAYHYDDDPSIGKYDLKLKPKAVPVVGHIIWNTDEEDDGNVTVNLYADGNLASTNNTLTASASNNNFEYDFGDRPKYHADGTEFVYTVQLSDEKKTEYEALGYQISSDGYDIVIDPPRTVTIDIGAVTLLSKAEYMSSKDAVQQMDNEWWWLITPTEAGGGVETVSYLVGDVVGRYVWADTGWVRPIIRYRNASETLPVGSKFSLAGHDWTVIANGIALCDDALVQMAFRADSDAPDATDYGASDVKGWLDNWALNSGLMPEAQFEISGATLLTQAEYTANQSNISRLSSDDWWLRTPSSLAYEVKIVHTNGEIFITAVDNNISVRPILLCDLSDKGLSVGDKVSVSGYEWTVLNDSMILCDSFIGKTKFNVSRSGSANDYNTSNVKDWIANWVMIHPFWAKTVTVDVIQ